MFGMSCQLADFLNLTFASKLSLVLIKMKRNIFKLEALMTDLSTSLYSVYSLIIFMDFNHIYFS